MLFSSEEPLKTWAELQGHKCTAASGRPVPVSKQLFGWIQKDWRGSNLLTAWHGQTESKNTFHDFKNSSANSWNGRWAQFPSKNTESGESCVRVWDYFQQRINLHFSQIRYDTLIRTAKGFLRFCTPPQARHEKTKDFSSEKSGNVEENGNVRNNVDVKLQK